MTSPSQPSVSYYRTSGRKNIFLTQGNRPAMAPISRYPMPVARDGRRVVVVALNEGAAWDIYNAEREKGGI